MSVAQSIDLWFNTTMGNNEYHATMNALSEPPAGIGVSSIIFTYNHDALDLPSNPAVGDLLTPNVDFTFHFFQGHANAWCYDGSGIRRSRENELTVNIVYTYSGPCVNGGVVIPDDGINMVTIHFGFENGASSNLDFVENGTDLFRDDGSLATNTPPSQFTVRNLTGSDDALPVELVSFLARSAAHGSLLSWETASESNSSGFEVQRSVNAGAWTGLGFVESRGTAVRGSSYTFDDTSIPFEAERIAYRLRQIDLDGTFAFSPTVEVERSAPESFVLHGNYPNPFNPSTAIRFELPEAHHVSVTVFDMLGRQVAVLASGQMQAGRHSLQFNAAHLPSGSYFYRIEAGQHSAMRKMLLVK